MTPGDLERRQVYYEDFSIAVGLADWREPNWRHELLRLYVDDLIGGTRNLEILDVGCGAGVMSSFLCRYGDVTGVDFSASAIELARALVPEARFEAGAIESLQAGRRHSLITLFDVLEHVPPAERSDFFATLGDLLVPGGWVLLSTPHAAHTQKLHISSPESLQVVDEPVPLAALTDLAREIGLELVHYQTYDVDRIGQRQYQLALFGPPAETAIPLVHAGLIRRTVTRLTAASTPPTAVLRRLLRAWRLVRAGRFRAAGWMLGVLSRPPSGSSPG
jgi:2-polyprenyl-3-methyl-5-hydroxy-6-metoxy-1,4-benzoquinol methylase